MMKIDAGERCETREKDRAISHADVNKIASTSFKVDLACHTKVIMS